MEDIQEIVNNIDKNEKLLGSNGVCCLTFVQDPISKRIGINIQGSEDPSAFVNSILKVSIDLLKKLNVADEKKEQICNKYIYSLIEYAGTNEFPFLYKEIPCQNNGEIIDSQLGTIVVKSIYNDLQKLSDKGIELITMFYVNDQRIDYVYAGDLENILTILSKSIIPVFTQLNVSKEDTAIFFSCLYYDVIKDLSTQENKSQSQSDGLLS